MKALMMVWAWVTFNPTLLPLFLLPVLWIIGKLLRSFFENMNFALILMISALVLGTATIYNFKHGARYYGEYLTKHGIQSEAVVTSVRTTDGGVDSPRLNVVSLLFNNQNQQSHTVEVTLSGARLFPKVVDMKVAPEIGDRLIVCYFPYFEEKLIVITDPTLSSWGQRNSCAILLARLKTAETRYRVEQSPTSDLKAGYREAITNALDSKCFTLSDRNHYRAVLTTIAQ